MSILNPSLVAGGRNRYQHWNSKFSGEHPEKRPASSRLWRSAACGRAADPPRPSRSVAQHSSGTLAGAAEILASAAQPGIHLENILTARQQESICLTSPSIPNPLRLRDYIAERVVFFGERVTCSRTRNDDEISNLSERHPRRSMRTVT
jgi:hypothetical protein